MVTPFLTAMYLNILANRETEITCRSGTRKPGKTNIRKNQGLTRIRIVHGTSGFPIVIQPTLFFAETLFANSYLFYV